MGHPCWVPLSSSISSASSSISFFLSSYLIRWETYRNLSLASLPNIFINVQKKFLACRQGSVVTRTARRVVSSMFLSRMKLAASRNYLYRFWCPSPVTGVFQVRWVGSRLKTSVWPIRSASSISPQLQTTQFSKNPESNSSTTVLKRRSQISYVRTQNAFVKEEKKSLNIKLRGFRGLCKKRALVVLSERQNY